MFDGKAYGEEIVGLVRGFVEREFAPLKAENEELRARLKAIEDRPLPEVIKGDPGESIDPEAINSMVTAEVERAVAAIPVPKDGNPGKDAAGIVEAMKDSGELVLTLQDGRLIRTGIRDGEDGKDAEPVEQFASGLTEEERTALVSAMLRKEIGEGELIQLPDPLPLPILSKDVPPAVVVHNHMPKRGVERTVVTKHDERGRIIEFERHGE